MGLNYNITQNNIEKLEIASWNESDAKFTGKVIPLLKKGDLVLRDLFFFKIKRFMEIEDKEAYYLSRYFLSTTLYVNDEKIEFLDFLKSKKSHKIIDEKVKISTQKLPTRLIAIRVSDEIYEQRVKALKKKYKQLKKPPTKSTLELQRYVIFITNIPKEMIAPQYIGTIYRFRWSIELVFKRWKSIFKIDRVTGTKGNRTLCFIYAKLIAILLISNFENYFFKKLKRISLKCYETRGKNGFPLLNQFSPLLPFMTVFGLMRFHRTDYFMGFNSCSVKSNLQDLGLSQWYYALSPTKDLKMIIDSYINPKRVYSSISQPYQKPPP